MKQSSLWFAFFACVALASLLPESCTKKDGAPDLQNVSNNSSTVVKENSSPAATPTGTTQRSFSDWLAAQSSYNGVQYWANSPNITVSTANMGAYNGAQITSNNKPTPLWVFVDYTGLCSPILQGVRTNLNLGTTVSGSVKETTYSDGSATVTVNIQTHNSITWIGLVASIDFTNYCTGNISISNSGVIYGYTMQQLLGNSALQPALSNLSETITYNETTPGMAFFNLSDVFQCSFSGSVSFSSFGEFFNGSGTLHPSSGLVTADAQVNCSLQNKQTPVNLSGSATEDAFPVESVRFSH